MTSNPKTTITIQTVACRATVRAIVRGEWAAHHALGNPGMWALTHVPSGGYLTMAANRRAMARALRALAALPPCPVRDFCRDAGHLTALSSTAFDGWLAEARKAVTGGSVVTDHTEHGTTHSAAALAARLANLTAALEAIASMDAPIAVARYVLDGLSFDEAMAQAAADLREHLAKPLVQGMRKRDQALRVLGLTALSGNWAELAIAADAYRAACEETKSE